MSVHRTVPDDDPVRIDEAGDAIDVTTRVVTRDRAVGPDDLAHAEVLHQVDLGLVEVPLSRSPIEPQATMLRTVVERNQAGAITQPLGRQKIAVILAPIHQGFVGEIVIDKCRTWWPPLGLSHPWAELYVVFCIISNALFR